MLHLYQINAQYEAVWLHRPRSNNEPRTCPHTICSIENSNAPSGQALHLMNQVSAANVRANTEINTMPSMRTAMLKKSLSEHKESGDFRGNLLRITGNHKNCAES